MLTIYIDNAIVSSNAEAIEDADIKMLCNEYMNFEISFSDYKKLCEIIDECNINIVVNSFDILDSFAEWLNEASDLIGDGVISWGKIRDAIEASGWEFYAADAFIAYDNEAKAGVRYMTQRNGKEIAVVE